MWTMRFLTIVLVFASAAASQEVEEPAAPPTQEQLIDRAVFRSHAAFTEILLDETADAERFTDLGDYYKSRGLLPQSANAYLIALRVDPKHRRARYQLACTFVHWDVKDLALEHLARAVDDGFWGWRLMMDDNELAPLRNEPAFQKLAAKVKARYDIEAPKHSGSDTVRIPSTPAPADGHPVIVLMHGMGSNRSDYEEICDVAAASGVIGVALDGSIVSDEDAYIWEDRDITITHNHIQQTLDKIQGTKLNRNRVLLGGFSQGANRALALAAHYPREYAGIVANSPGGESHMNTRLPNGVKPPPLYLFVGLGEGRTVREKVADAQNQWRSAQVAVETFEFDGGHQFPPDSKQRYKDAILWLLEQPR
jgi:predicted esterase